MADGTQYGPRGPELFMWPRNNKNHNISKFLKLSFFWDTLYMQLDSSLLAASFSPSGLGMDKKCPYLGCLWGAWMVSVGCLDGLGVIWDTSMGDKIVILNEKVQSLSYNSHTTFSHSAHFLAKIGQK